MSNQAETPQRSSRRAHKAPKASENPQSSQIPTMTPTIPSYETPDLVTGQPTNVLQASNLAVTEGASGILSLAASAPSTPPRSHSTQPSSTKKNQAGIESTTGLKQKRDGHGTQTVRQKAPPKSKQGGTPPISVRPNTTTPGRPSETPSKAAYAGPTFHASPAASSLPLPKFLSKSVPNVNKITSVKKMAESDLVDTTSESEGSPLVDHEKPEHDRRTREESPLDIFFQADRKAKAKASSGAKEPVKGIDYGLSPFQTLRPDSSPSHKASRHHSRHPTDTSAGGIFALEMGDPAPKDFNSLSSHLTQPNLERSVSAPSGGVTEEQAKEQQRQAKTEALKKMLFSPQLQRPELSSKDLQSPSALGSPSSKTRQQRVCPNRDDSRPASSPGLASDASHAQRQAALFALAQKQIPLNSTHTNQRQASSNLRKEMSIPKSPGQPRSHEPSENLISALTIDSSPSANTRSRASALPKPPVPNQPLENLILNPRNLRDVPPSGPSPTTKSIEDDLRRILKLEVLGSDGVTRS